MFIQGNLFVAGVEAPRDMYLFFDTETTGLSPGSRVVQLAWVLTDETGKTIDSANDLIRPDGFTIPADASRIHGITTERASKDGIALSQALEKFRGALQVAKFAVAHNLAYDSEILKEEFKRIGMESPLGSKKTFCTMQGSVNFCAIDGPYGYKWPKLAVLHKKLFDAEFEGAHDASSDVAATVKCFFELRKRGVL